MHFVLKEWISIRNKTSHDWPQSQLSGNHTAQNCKSHELFAYTPYQQMTATNIGTWICIGRSWRGRWARENFVDQLSLSIIVGGVLLREKCWGGKNRKLRRFWLVVCHFTFVVSRRRRFPHVVGCSLPCCVLRSLFRPNRGRARTPGRCFRRNGV